MPDITEETIRELAAFKGREPVTSCFLDVDGRRLLHQQQIEQELESVLKPARIRANGHSPGVSHDLDRIEKFVRDGFDRSGTRGLAMFSCAAPELWKVVPLPVPVRSRIVVNSQPAVGELKAMAQQAERLGVLLVDRQRARMFVFELGDLVEHTEQIDELPRDVDTRPKSERSDHANHIDELREQHLHHAARLAWDVYQRVGFERFTANAPEDVTVRLRELYHPYLRERFCGRIAVTPTGSTEEIRKAALDVQERIKHDRGRTAMSRFVDAVGTGRGVRGLDATLDALGSHRVDTLVVSQGFEKMGWRCEPCGQLNSSQRTCPSCGAEMMELHDVVEEAVEAAFAQSGHVEIVADNADLDAHGRIGALLRY